VAEVKGVEGIGGVTRELTCARHAAANPHDGEALASVDIVGLDLNLVQTVYVPRDSKGLKIGLESLRRVVIVTKHQNYPPPAAITRARLALAC
jgi:hypothetical protein